MSNIAIQGAATGTGVFTLASPATNTDRTLTLPDEAGTVLTSAGSLPAGNLTGSVPASAMPAGSVLQVVSNATSNEYGTTSTSFQTENDPAVTITPTSASSKFLVLYTTEAESNVAETRLTISIGRSISGGSSTNNITNEGDGFGQHRSAAGSHRTIATVVYLDSPATTSAITYKPSFRSSSGNAVYIGGGGALSTMTVMEIAG